MSESKQSQKSKNEDLLKDAASNTTALNPLVGIRGQDLFAAGTNVVRAIASQPQTFAKQWLSFARTTLVPAANRS